MKHKFFTMIGLMMAYTVFILLYPEYALPSDLCYYVEDGEEIPYEEATEALQDIIDARPGEVEIRFRLLDTLMKTFDMEGKQTCQEEINRKQEHDLFITDRKHRLESLTQGWVG